MSVPTRRDVPRGHGARMAEKTGQDEVVRRCTLKCMRRSVVLVSSALLFALAATASAEIFNAQSPTHNRNFSGLVGVLEL